MIVSPSYGFGTSGRAVTGYPIISVPVGLAETGWPAGIWMTAGSLSEPTLLAYAYDLEQELDARSQPTFAGAVPEPPPPLGICPTDATAAVTAEQARQAVTGRRGPDRRCCL